MLQSLTLLWLNKLRKNEMFSEKKKHVGNICLQNTISYHSCPSKMKETKSKPGFRYIGNT
ncbi:hypothetical protein Hanom_Chr06g00527701 [Helianthus anomalus]